MILQKCQKKYNLHLKKSKEMAYYMQNVCSSQHSSVVELLICNQWVAGSNPAAGSIFLCVNCTNEGAEAGKEAYQKTVLCNFCVIPGLPRHSTWFRIADTKNPAAGSIFLPFCWNVKKLRRNIKDTGGYFFVPVRTHLLNLKNTFSRTHQKNRLQKKIFLCL